MNRTMTVAQLSAYVRGVFDDEELLHDVTLVGEVADISYSDKHTFLVLADGAFSVRCVHFSSRDTIEKGARVALRGSVSFYDKRNTVSFNYSEFFLQGVGDKNAKLAAVKEKLRSLGYFENRPRLPKYIVNVVVVTSPDGAAIRDFMRVVYDKSPFVNIRVYPVKVQGEGAAAQMANAVNKLQKCKTDAIVLCRGGGSDEDLDCFNDEELATAVALSKLPVISAVGHEINFSLCDFCAGTRAGTPSIAGEIVNAHAAQLIYDLSACAYAMREGLAAKYNKAVFSLSRLGTSTTSAVAARLGEGYNTVRSSAIKSGFILQRKLDAKNNALSLSADRLKTATGQRLNERRVRCDKLTALLSALDPHRIIKIGYAAVMRDKLRIKSARELKPNDEIKLVFDSGVATAVVKEVKTKG
ncbi:MAG: exodeoxyribonuclease VII large subunit [Clostridiales bacterium]|nr:exodeoxyribonuclease VII large subunit [Clostridiales bacterium]